MNKKGFTLIELLAVMVILAIIALITIPLVVSLVNDAELSAMLSSANHYLNTVENIIMKERFDRIPVENGTYTIMPSGNLCLQLENDECKKGYIEVEIDGDSPNNGILIIENSKLIDVKLVYGEKTIIKDKSDKLVFRNHMCILLDGKHKEIGSKYECEVKDGVKYNFYVLSTNKDGTSNLIMDRNIYYDSATGKSEEANSINTGLVAWMDSTDYGYAGGKVWSSWTDNNMFGPVTAMNYLYNATKDWDNVPNINMNYTDENTVKYGYGKIVTNVATGLTQITKRDGTLVTVLKDQTGYSNLKARMPYNSEVSDSNENNEFLYDNLDQSEWEGAGPKPDNSIEGIFGYWIHSSASKYSYFVMRLSYKGSIIDTNIDRVTDNGVRPVITLEL